MAIVIRAVPMRLGLIVCLICFVAGCSSLATQKAFYEPIQAELRAGNYANAISGIEAARDDKKYKEKDRVVYYLDAGLAYHYAGCYDSSNLRLTKAEDAADELFTKSISRAAASAILNDNILEYSGEDYEILYANLIKSLNYLSLGMFDDAFVEIRRANEKLVILEQKYRKASDILNKGASDDTSRVDINYEAEQSGFNNSAFARYLSMRMYAAEGRYDDAQLDYDLIRRAFIEQPHIYNFEMPELFYHSDNGAVLSIVALLGNSPVKEALNLRLRSDKDLDIIQIMYDDQQMENSEYSHLPVKVSEDYYFKFSIPKIVAIPSVVSQINVYANDEPLGELSLLEDVAGVASETFKARKSLILLRTAARAIAKGLVTHKMKRKYDKDGFGGWLKKLAIDAITDVSENADLRCSRLLPGKILVGDFVIRPGVYNIRVDFIDYQNNLLESKLIPDYKVNQFGLNLIESFLIK